MSNNNIFWAMLLAAAVILGVTKAYMTREDSYDKGYREGSKIAVDYMTAKVDSFAQARIDKLVGEGKVQVTK